MVRYALVSVLALLAVAGSSTYAAELMTADQQAIAKIESEWGEATKSKSKAFYEKNLSEDFWYTDDNGVFHSGRAAYIDLVMKGPKIVEVTEAEDRVAVHGTTGVATGRFTVKDNAGVTLTTLYTDVYAKGPDGWKAVASQETQAK